jgi:hypothetical protein
MASAEKSVTTNRFNGRAVIRCEWVGLEARIKFLRELQRNPTVNNEFEPGDVFRLV